MHCYLYSLERNGALDGWRTTCSVYLCEGGYSCVVTAAAFTVHSQYSSRLVVISHSTPSQCTTFLICDDLVPKLEVETSLAPPRRAPPPVCDLYSTVYTTVYR
jgi:hypothetical protein